MMTLKMDQATFFCGMTFRKTSNQTKQIYLRKRRCIHFSIERYVLFGNDIYVKTVRDLVLVFVFL